MPIEDFTTYIEVEEITDIFSVAANKIDFTDVPLNESSYVYKDFGVEHFSDFSHFVTLYLDSNNIGSAQSQCGYSIQNEITDIYSIIGDGIYTFITALTNVYKIWNLEIDNGTIGDFDNSPILVDTPYYLTVSRNGNTHTVLIYNDSDRTNLIDTITATVITTEFQYNMALTTWDQGVNTTRHITGYIENLDLQEISVVPSIMQQMDQFNGGVIL